MDGHGSRHSRQREQQTQRCLAVWEDEGFVR